MHAHQYGRGPGIAASEAAASLRLAGTASVVADAVAPAGLNPKKESTPAAQATQSREQNDPSNSGTDPDVDQAFLTQRALLAMKGYSLSRTNCQDGPVCFHVNRWGMVRELRDVAAVRAFAQQVGASND